MPKRLHDLPPFTLQRLEHEAFSGKVESGDHSTVFLSKMRMVDSMAYWKEPSIKLHACCQPIILTCLVSYCTRCSDIVVSCTHQSTSSLGERGSTTLRSKQHTAHSLGANEACVCFNVRTKPFVRITSFLKPPTPTHEIVIRLRNPSTVLHRPFIIKLRCWTIV